MISRVIFRSVGGMAGAAMLLFAIARAVVVMDWRALGPALPGLLLLTYAVRGKTGIPRFDAKL